MFEEDFIKRLTELRLQKNISARDMSLSIGQNQNYINNIENGKAMPSMSAFFFICEFLKITPSEFFETKTRSPEKMRNVMKDLQSLSQKNFDNIAEIINALTKI